MSYEMSNVVHEMSYPDRLEHILDSALNLENLGDYVERSLTDLINLISDMLDEYYSNRPIDDDLCRKELEDRVFEFFGVADISQVMSAIGLVYDGLDKADRLLNSMEESPSRVFIPPDLLDLVPEAGEGEFASRSTQPKSKLILYILTVKFGIDIEDEEQVLVKVGSVLPRMFRNEPYRVIIARSIDRLALVCDESSNITYVFTISELPATLGVDSIVDLTKSEINALIQSNPRAGVRIQQDHRYTENILSALSNDGTIKPVPIRPLAPGNMCVESAYVSFRVIAEELDLDMTRLRRAVVAAKRRGYLAEIEITLDTKTNTYMLSRHEADVCIAFLKSMLPHPGVIQRSVFRKLIDATPSRMHRAEASLLSEGKINQPVEYIFEDRISVGYTLEQQNEIKQYIDRLTHFQKATEDKISVGRLAKSSGVSQITADKAVSELVAEGKITEPGVYLFNSKLGKGLNGAEAELVRERFASYSNDAPQGVQSLYSFGKENNFQRKVLETLVKELLESGELCPLSQFRFGAVLGLGIDQSQQELISRRYYEQMPPPEVMSVKKFSISINRSTTTVKEAISLAIAEGMTSLGYYKFRGKPSAGLTRTQQEIVLEVVGRT
jgi:DNA-binding Lrp family transcriptional regulator